MRPGSVIVDLAAEAGGNCELTEPDEVVVEHGVTIHGPTNLPATMPVHASQLYARNVTELLNELVKDGALALDFDDEIVKGACVTHGGEIVNDAVKAALAGEGRHDDRARSRPLHLHARAGFLLAAHRSSSATTSSPASRRCCTRRSCRRPTRSRRSRWSARSSSPAATTATSRTAGCAPLGFIAVTCSATNAVGGFLITDRMLRMFKTAGKRADAAAAERGVAFVLRRLRCVAARALRDQARRHGDGRYLHHVATEALRYCYIVSAAMFVLGLKGRARPSGRARVWRSRPSACSSRWSARSSTTTSCITAIGLHRRRRDRRSSDGAPHPDDRRAAAHRAVALARRARGVPRRRLRVLPLPGRARRRRDADALDFEVVVGGLTFTGSLDRGGQAPGAAARAADHVPGRTSSASACCSRHRALGLAIWSATQATPFFYVMVALSLVFGLLLVIPIGAADMPVVIALAQLVRRARRRGDGLRADEQDPDHHRLARRHLGLPARAAHVSRDEPLGVNVLFGALRQGVRRRGVAAAAEAKGTVRSITAEETAVLFETAATSSSCPATAWRSRRRSTRSPSWRTS